MVRQAERCLALTPARIVTRDLFANDDEQGTWLDAPTLLDKLATEKLEDAAQTLRSRATRSRCCSTAAFRAAASQSTFTGMGRPVSGAFSRDDHAVREREHIVALPKGGEFANLAFAGLIGGGDPGVDGKVRRVSV